MREIRGVGSPTHNGGVPLIGLIKEGELSELCKLEECHSELSVPEKPDIVIKTSIRRCSLCKVIAEE